LINPFVIKKWAALLLVGFFTVISFYIGILYLNFWWAMGIMLVALLIISFLASALLSNPFTKMMEGSGILVMNLDSTGVIRFSIVKLRPPFVYGKIGKEEINDVWDRSTVLQIEAPKTNKIFAEKVMQGQKRGGLRIEIDEKEYNDSRFALFHYPVLIWNDQMKSLITKEWISKEEKDTFAEHGILYLNRKLEELTMLIRDFARHTAEQMRPKISIFKNKWVWIAVVVLMVILVAMFLPPVINIVSKNFAGQAESAIGSIGSQAVIPR